MGRLAGAGRGIPWRSMSGTRSSKQRRTVLAIDVSSRSTRFAEVSMGRLAGAGRGIPWRSMSGTRSAEFPGDRCPARVPAFLSGTRSPAFPARVPRVPARVPVKAALSDVLGIVREAFVATPPATR
ncbi:MAG: hypothetical protein IPO09_13520 [Anaeromyxobacter sp.]|nr:hypothetical protein [Anaeromyxobacter sp.]